MYLEIFLADFAVFHVFWGISQDFAEIPEFRGSATARNIRSPESSLKKQPTFGDATTGFPAKFGRKTSGSIAKCQLFSQAIGKGKQIQLNTTHKNKEQVDCS